jgi:hypothetical protein
MKKISRLFLISLTIILNGYAQFGKLSTYSWVTPLVLASRGNDFFDWALAPRLQTANKRENKAGNFKLCIVLPGLSI